MPSGLTDEQAIRLLEQCVNQAERRHAQKVLNWLTNYKAYRGVLRGVADRWRSRLAPKYGFQILETLYCNIAEENPRVKILPLNAGSVHGARCMTKIRNYQRTKDYWAEKLPFYGKQGLIMGGSPMKISWDQQVVQSRGRRYTTDPVTGLTVEEWYEGPLMLKDQPTFTPHDVTDFLPDPHASRIDECGWVIFRYWVSYDQLYELRERKGENGEPLGVYKNVEDLKETRNGVASGQATAMPLDESAKHDRDGQIEVLELWSRDFLLAWGNRRVLLRNQGHPYQHRQIPAVYFSSNPDLYSIDGISEMEVIRDLQWAVWFFLNQRIDNTRLLNNAIILTLNPDADTDLYEFKPGAIWPVDSPNDIDVWTPDHNIVEVSIQAEEQLKSDMMNLTSAIPTLSGAWEGADPQTATEVNTQQALAAQRLKVKKMLLNGSLRRAELQAIALNQQLMSAPIEHRISKGEDDYDFEQLTPAEIALGEFDASVLDGDESALRMQERAEANEMLGALATEILPICQAFGVQPNVVPILEKWASSYGFPDGAEIFHQLPPGVQAALQAASMQGGGGAGPAPLAGGAPPGPGQPLLPPGNGQPEPQTPPSHVLNGPGGPIPFPQ